MALYFDCFLAISDIMVRERGEKKYEDGLRLIVQVLLQGVTSH